MFCLQLWWWLVSVNSTGCSWRRWSSWCCWTQSELLCLRCFCSIRVFIVFVCFSCWFAVVLFPDRVSADSLAKEVVLGLRVFRDPVDFLEQLELMDPRSVDDYQTTQMISLLHNVVYVWMSWSILLLLIPCINGVQSLSWKATILHGTDVSLLQHVWFKSILLDNILMSWFRLWVRCGAGKLLKHEG